jgi:hypothetical protein
VAKCFCTSTVLVLSVPAGAAKLREVSPPKRKCHSASTTSPGTIVPGTVCPPTSRQSTRHLENRRTRLGQYVSRVLVDTRPVHSSAASRRADPPASPATGIRRLHAFHVGDLIIDRQTSSAKQRSGCGRHGYRLLIDLMSRWLFTASFHPRTHTASLHTDRIQR